MSDVVISVQNLGKKYRIRHQAEGRRYTALRDVIAQKFTAPFRWLKKSPRPSDGRGIKGEVSNRPQASSEDFWALKDVSFEVKRGEVVGIIGRNGAGKSTLLKILSRITEPSEGRVEIEGRVASLLEVGTGFHPELTGRENIFLNGAILGMHRAEIKKKFDEIVAFAEVEKFLDTPVKRYSSGMYVRLAFAVAAHLEPEILIVDEVLAVGDAEFQKKCLGKMRDVSRKEGRTVLFVSHNMQAINVLCSGVILLKNGKVVEHGPTKKIIDVYLNSGTHNSAEVVWEFESAPTGSSLKLHTVKVGRANGETSFNQFCGEAVIISMEFWCLRALKVVPNFHIYNQHGILVFPTSPLHQKEIAGKFYEAGLHRSFCVIPAALLNAGTYFIHAYLSRATDGYAYVHVPDVVSFQVIDDGTGRGETNIEADWPGVIRPLLTWTSEKLEDLSIS